MSARQGLLSGSKGSNRVSNRSRGTAGKRKRNPKSNAYELRVRQASQPRTKRGAAVSSQYQGRVQVNASRLPGSWSNTYHAPAPDTVYSSTYIASLLTRRAPAPLRRPIANVAQSRRWEYSEKLQRCITKTSYHAIGRQASTSEKLEGWNATGEMAMRGAPALFDDCVSFEASPEQPAMRSWHYKWSDERAMVYVGKSLIDGKAVYELGDRYRVGLLSRMGELARVVYHKPAPMPMVANPLVRHVRPAVPNLENMLQIWKACVLEYGM
jgi:hypothetical protein